MTSFDRKKCKGPLNGPKAATGRHCPEGWTPYPLGFFSKLEDGRIDDPDAGWKGRGRWTMSGTRTVFHNEGGTKNSPKVYKLQVRPDPLAK